MNNENCCILFFYFFISLVKHKLMRTKKKITLVPLLRHRLSVLLFWGVCVCVCACACMSVYPKIITWSQKLNHLYMPDIFIKNFFKNYFHTLCNPMDCSLPGSSVHRIFQARIPGWVAISFSGRSSWPRDWTEDSCIVGRCFTAWATRKVISILLNQIMKSILIVLSEI